MATTLAFILVFIYSYISIVATSSCQHNVTCPCGSTNQNFTFCLNHIFLEEDVCERWVYCEECREDLEFCAKCPDGLSGPTCTEGDVHLLEKMATYHPRQQVISAEEVFVRQKRQFLDREKRQQRICPRMEAPVLGAMNCTQVNSFRTCTGRCLPGYTFEDRDGEYQMTLRCRRGNWSPLRYFPDCKAGDSCKLDVHGAGYFNCTVGMEGTRCDVICGGHYEGRFHCYLGSEWIPPLPRCVRAKGESGRGQPICRCQNGGICNTYNRCLCSIGFTGEYCEHEQRTEVTCPDPGIPPGAERVNSDGSRSPFPREFLEGESVVYSCSNTETALTGRSFLTCTVDGTWSAPTPRCIRPSTATAACSDPGMVANAERLNPDGSPSTEFRSFFSGQSVVYNCHQGYALHGSSIRTCRSNGQWSGRRPRCTRVRPLSITPESPAVDNDETFCQDPGVNENGEVLDAPAIDPIRRNERYPAGSEVKYGCLDGYVLDGAGVIFCTSSGQWSNPAPGCAQQPRSPGVSNLQQPLFCRNLGQLTNGRILQTSIIDPRRRGQGFPAGSEIRFACYDGFEIIGESKIYCLNTGEWSANKPTCELLSRSPIATGNEDPDTYCINPGPVLNGGFRVLSSGRLSEDEDTFPENTRLQYYCEGLHWLRGGDTIICDRSGSWFPDLPYCEEECGRSLMIITHRITNGTSTVAGQWPWVVSISVQNGPNGNATEMKCGGVLIDETTVLTAAHCLVDFPRYLLHFGKYHRLTRLDDNKVVDRMSSQLIIHPSYNATSYENDIALIKLSSRIQYTIRIQPICLPTFSTSDFNIQPNNYGHVTGWGLTETGLQSEKLMMANISVQPSDQCSRAYEQIGLRDRIRPGMFCAGLEEGITSACTGDSGSALVFYDEQYERYTVEGIVSFSVAGMCGVPGIYTVFTKVIDYIAWIQRNMR